MLVLYFGQLSLRTHAPKLPLRGSKLNPPQDWSSAHHFSHCEREPHSTSKVTERVSAVHGEYAIF